MNYEKISYNFYRNRKKFDPRKLFYKNKSLSYEEFCKYFDSINVYAPNFEYYKRVKDSLSFEENNENKIKYAKLESKKTKTKSKSKRKKTKDESD